IREAWRGHRASGFEEMACSSMRRRGERTSFPGAVSGPIGAIGSNAAWCSSMPPRRPVGQRKRGSWPKSTRVNPASTRASGCSRISGRPHRIGWTGTTEWSSRRRSSARGNGDCNPVSRTAHLLPCAPMTNAHSPIGTPGRPWGAPEIDAWRSRQTKQRSYADDVLTQVKRLEDRFELVEYGRLQEADEVFPLVALRNRDWDERRPLALITGGVHGYETSGVHGALHFAAHEASAYVGTFDLLIAPCVSPWAYERIHRWNPAAVDPNRSFQEDSPAPESAALMQLVAPWRERFRLHIDLHETTDSDETE